MTLELQAVPLDGHGAWLIVRELGRLARSGSPLAQRTWFHVERGTQVVQAPAERGSLWVDPQREPAFGAPTALRPEVSLLLSLYLPLCLGARSNGLVIAHLGQSLDGQIATSSGASRYVTSDENLVHVHRLRALCDAVVVGASTVERDDPQLTTRKVPGDNPARVVLDPTLRTLSARLWTDRAARTLVVCARGRAEHARVPDAVELVELPLSGGRLEPAQIVAELRSRGLSRVLVEGGGLTVSRFLQARAAQRLHLCVSPVLLGSGRPGLALPPIRELGPSIAAQDSTLRARWGRAVRLRTRCQLRTLSRAMSLAQLFVVPELRGRPTGGTLYNRRLLSALTALGQTLSVSDAEDALGAIREGEFDVVWVDSLYLELAPSWRELPVGRSRLGLLLHYLPALVAHGAGATRAQLSRSEHAALAAAELGLVTSQFMKNAVVSLGFDARPLLCVEPGCELGASGTLPTPEGGVRALLVAHVVNGKGIEPLLVALARTLAPSDRFVLRIVGDVGAEPGYAARCQALVAREPALRARVTFSGTLSEQGVKSELAASNLLLSASVMESYGMALAEGRAVGLPIVARDAGNVFAHVRAEAGGELVADADELGQACVRLCRDPNEHARRLSAAQAHVPAQRRWHDAACELISALQVPGVLPEFAVSSRERA